MTRFCALFLLSVLSFTAFASNRPARTQTLHCYFNQWLGPSAYMRLDAGTRTVWVASGWPMVWHQYSNIVVRRGLPGTPYAGESVTLLKRGGHMPLVHLRANPALRGYQKEREVDVSWGVIPGMPIGQPGVCKAQNY